MSTTLKAYERTVKFYDVKAHAYCSSQKGISPMHLKKTFTLLKTKTPQKLWTYTIKRGDQKLEFELSEIKITDTDISLLVRHIDKEAADNAVRDKVTNKLKVLSPKKNEEYERACHIYIKLQDDAEGEYLCLVEHIPNISTSVIKRLLNSILAQTAELNKKEFTTPALSGEKDKDGNPVIYPFRMLLNIDGHMDDRFAQMLKDGIFSDATFISESAVSIPGIDMGEEKLVKKHQIKVNLSEIEGDIRKTLLTFGQKMNFSKLRVRVGSASDGVNVDLDMSDGEPLNDLRYVKKEVLTDFTGKLSTSYESISDEMVDKMKVLL